jgi:hypothetical protein
MEPFGVRGFADFLKGLRTAFVITIPPCLRTRRRWRKVLEDLCVVYVLVRHVDAGADEDGHKWLPLAAHNN